MEPSGGRTIGEGSVIYLERGVENCIKVFQDEMLAIICPIADRAPLNKR